MKFDAHGEFDLTCGNNYVLVHTFGGFNREGVRALFDAAISAATEHSFTQWYYLELIDKDAFITPDAIDMLKLKYTDLKAAGCKQVIAVCGNWMQTEVITQLRPSLPLPIQLANSEAEAIEAITD